MVLSVVAEDESLSIALTCIDHFKYISGLGMNKNKSTIIRIGSIKYTDLTLLSGSGLNWSDGKFQFLGISLSVETGQISDLNYPKRLNKITKCLNIWNLKVLSILGYATYPKLKLYEQSKTKCINLFGTIRDRFKRAIINQEYKLGCCKMIDINVQNECLKLAWIPHIFCNLNCFWIEVCIRVY